MSQILSKLNAIKLKLQSSVREKTEALTSHLPGQRDKKTDPETRPAPTPVLKANINVQNHRHRLSAVLRWLVGNAGQLPAFAKVLVSAAFFGSVMLVTLSIFFMPFPRNKIRPPQNVRTSPSNAYPKPDAARAPAQAKPQTVASPTTTPSATPSGVPAGAPTAPPTPKPSRSPSKQQTSVPTEVIEKIREGATSADRQKIAIATAKSMISEGKSELAVALLERTTGENPSWIEALLLLAEEYRKTEKLDPSAGALLRILQVEPTHALAYNNLGMIQMRKKKPAQAIPYLERAFTLDQSTPEVALNLGIAYEQTLTWGKAVVAYEHFLKLRHPQGGLSKDRVINAVRFRMQRLQAFARAQGTLEPSLAQSKQHPEENLENQEGSADSENPEPLPLATGPVVDPNPIQTAKDNGPAAAAVTDRQPATELPKELKKR